MIYRKIQMWHFIIVLIAERQMAAREIFSLAASTKCLMNLNYECQPTLTNRNGLSKTPVEILLYAVSKAKTTGLFIN